DRFERLQEARVVGREEPQVQQLQYAGVEIVSRESGGEALRLRAPGGLLDMGPDMIGTFLPELGSLGQVECHRRVRQTIAGSPAHRRRIRVNALPGSELPQAGIGLIVVLPGAPCAAVGSRDDVSRRCAPLTLRSRQPSPYDRADRPRKWGRWHAQVRARESQGSFGCADTCGCLPTYI